MVRPPRIPISWIQYTQAPEFVCPGIRYTLSLSEKQLLEYTPEAVKKALTFGRRLGLGGSFGGPGRPRLRCLRHAWLQIYHSRTGRPRRIGRILVRWMRWLPGLPTRHAHSPAAVQLAQLHRLRAFNEILRPNLGTCGGRQLPGCRIDLNSNHAG